MIKILQIRESSPTKCSGIDSNCQSLFEIFKNDLNIDVLRIEDYPYTSIPVLNRRIITYKTLLNSIISSEADIIHIHGFAAFSTPLAIRVAKKCGKKIIFTPHFHPFNTLRSPFLGKIFFKTILKPSLKFVDAIITLNNEDTNVFKKIHENIIRIPHFVRFDKNNNTEMITKKSNMILFVGRLYETNKGIEHLYHLPKNKYEIHCVGKGELKRSDFIQHSDISDEELSQLYRQASLVVVPSRYEAFSYVSLEAFASGTPVVMSERVRIADYLENCIGFSIFKYSDYRDFCNSVALTIGREVDSEKILSIFDSQSIKKQYENIYCKL